MISRGIAAVMFLSRTHWHWYKEESSRKRQQKNIYLGHFFCILHFVSDWNPSVTHPQQRASLGIDYYVMLIESNKRGHCTHCENTQQKNCLNLHLILKKKKKKIQFHLAAGGLNQIIPIEYWHRRSRQNINILTLTMHFNSLMAPPSVSGPYPEYFSFRCRIDLHRAVCGRCYWRQKSRWSHI